MRTFIIVVCSLALACSAGAAQNDNKSKKQAQKNRPTQSAQRTATAGAPKRATPKRYQQTSPSATSYQKAKGRQGVNNQVYQSRSNVKARSAQQVTTRDMQAGRYATKKTKQGQQGAEAFPANRRTEYADWSIRDVCKLFQEDKTMER